MTMYKKDYKEIAKAIKNSTIDLKTMNREQFLLNLLPILEKSNSDFDRQKFGEAIQLWINKH